MTTLRADHILRLSEHFLEARSEIGDKPTSWSYYLPKITVAQAIEHFAAQIQPKKKTSLFLDLPFLNALLNYSLGGSVAQIRTKETDDLLKLCLNPAWNVDQQEEDTGSNLGAQNLTVVLSEQQVACLKTELPAVLENLKNKGAKRIVLQVAKDIVTPEIFQIFIKNCEKLSLTAFPTSSETLDYSFFVSSLIDASLWGRYLENTQNLVEQIKNALPDAQMYFRIQGKPQLIENLEHFLPSQLLRHHDYESLPSESMTLFAGFDGLKWVSAKSEHSCSLIPTSLLHLDQVKQIEFVDTQLKMSPGPLCFGRGSKLMVLDFLIYRQHQNGQKLQIVGLDISTHLTKVEQALQNLWRLSAYRTEPFEHFLKQIQERIRDHLQIDFLHFRSEKIYGPLQMLFNFGDKK